MRLCRGFGVFGWGDFFLYLPSILVSRREKKQKRIRASPKLDSLIGYVIIYPRRMYPANLAGIPDAFLVFGFKQPLEEVWAAEGVVPTAMADAR